MAVALRQAYWEEREACYRSGLEVRLFGTNGRNIILSQAGGWMTKEICLSNNVRAVT